MAPQISGDKVSGPPGRDAFGRNGTGRHLCRRIQAGNPRAGEFSVAREKGHEAAVSAE